MIRYVQGVCKKDMSKYLIGKYLIMQKKILFSFLFQHSEDTPDTDDDSEDVSEYEYEETYTLTEWFPPDYWRSQLETAKQSSFTKTLASEPDKLHVGADEDEEDEFYYNLLKSKMRAAENVVVTDVKVNDVTITFKVKT